MAVCVVLPKYLNPLSANFTKWSNKLIQFVGNLLTNCLSVFGHFVGLVIKGLIYIGNHIFSNLQHAEICPSGLALNWLAARSHDRGFAILLQKTLNMS